MADVPEKQVKRLRALIQEAETNLAAANELLVSLVGDDEKVQARVTDDILGKVIEGVFDGQNMVGSDGKTYPVPANYASKSKLVQGDILKLTIADDTQTRGRTLLRGRRQQKLPCAACQRDLLQSQAGRPSQCQRSRGRFTGRVGRTRSCPVAHHDLAGRDSCFDHR